MCCQVRFITISVKCMVTMRWAMAWLGNGFGCSIRTRERARRGVKWASIFGEWWFGAQGQRKSAWRQTFHNFWSVPALSSNFKDSTLILWVVANIAGGRILWGGYTKLVSRYGKCLNNGGEYVEKTGLKNVESDNNKFFYETLLDFFFLQRTGTYFLNKPRIWNWENW